MRFEPDTLLDALLRPLAMAAPNGHVYVEMMAPDFRFLFAIFLLALWGALALAARRRTPSANAGAATSARPLIVLLAALAVAFVAWMASNGNGRYFMVGLLAVGPVCAGLAWRLPVTRALRLTIVGGMVALQAFAVQQAAPWRSWSYLAWEQAPYFHVEIPEDVRARPATYMTLSAISYSLLAPMFHPQSRWISLHNAPPPDGGSPDAHRTKDFLSRQPAGSLLLLVPAVSNMMTPDRLPDARVSAGLDAQLAAYRLALARPQACRFLASRSLAAIGVGQKTAEERARSGFWLCELVRAQPAAAPAGAQRQGYEDVFRLLESQCPRFFPAGGDGHTLKTPDGEVRSYHRGDMKAYVYDDGDVFYKYHRAIGPVRVGTVQDLLGGRMRVDCSSIRGRSGLPWDRDI